MKGQIVFAPNGQLVVAIDNDGMSTFDEAAAKSRAQNRAPADGRAAGVHR